MSDSWQEQLREKLAGDAADKIIHALESDDTGKILAALFIGLLVDMLQALATITIAPALALPVVGQVVVPPLLMATNVSLALFGGVVISIVLFQIGGFLRMKIRAVVGIAQFFELIPLVGALPINFLALLWAYRRIKKHREEALVEAEEAGVDVDTI